MERIPESEAIAEPVDARRFNEVMSSNRFRQADYRRLACRAVELGTPPGGKVLDMGTGSGFVAIEVAKLLEEPGVGSWEWIFPGRCWRWRPRMQPRPG